MPYLIFIIAFIIRIVYVIQIRSTVFYSNFMLDEAFYNNWALSIAKGDWLGTGLFNGLPLYPYALGIIYKVFGHNLFIARFTGALLGPASCVLLYLLAREVFNRRAGIIAGFIAALYGPLILYSGVFVPTALEVFLYLSALLLFFKALNNKRGKGFFLFGLIAGLASLTRASMLLCAPVLFLWVVIVSKERKKALINSVIGIAGILLIIMPVVLRNYIVTKELVFSTSHAGINFYIGNNKYADGRFKAPARARSNIEGLKTDAKSIAEKELNKDLTDSQVSAYYTSKAAGFIRDNPSDFLRLLWRKLLLFINKQELYDAVSYPVYKQSIPVLRFPFITFMLTAPLGLAGMVIALRQWKKLMPLYLFTAVYTFSIILFFVNSRYRMLFAVIMILFAGFFLSWLFEAINTKKLLKAVLGIVLCVLVFLPVNISTGICETATGYNNLGNLYVKTGEYDKAIAAFEKAMEVNPSDVKSYNDAGYACVMKGDFKKAKKYLLVALSMDPDYAFSRINMGLLHEAEGGMRAAEGEYKEAVRLNPNIAQAHNNLAGLYEKSGRRPLAIKEYQKAIALDPDNPKTHYNIAVVYARSGNLKKAEAEFREALRLDSDFTAARKALDYFQ